MEHLIAQDELLYTKKYNSIEKAVENPDSVFQLDLSRRDLSILPTELIDLPKLQVLMLDFNNLKTLNPRVLENLSLLQILFLEFNKIEQFPTEIGVLVHLKHLNIEGNPIDNLPESFFQLDSLEGITAGYTNIPLSTWKRLKTLHPDIEIRLDDGLKYDTTLTESNFQDRYEKEVMGL